eukprot:1810772-Pyramimonas_sp.AAC.1
MRAAWPLLYSPTPHPVLYALRFFKLCGATELLSGLGGELSDAPRACAQASLCCDGRIEPVDAWIAMFKWRQSASWAKYEHPVCRLRLALYGHPLAGVFRGRRCRACPESVGFRFISGRKCVWGHDKLNLFFSVYVDDFKMAGPKTNLNRTT